MLRVIGSQLLSSVQGVGKNIRTSATTSSPQQRAADGTHRHLHIRVTKARKFTEHLPVPGSPFSEVSSARHAPAVSSHQSSGKGGETEEASCRSLSFCSCYSLSFSPPQPRKEAHPAGR